MWKVLPSRIENMYRRSITFSVITFIPIIFSNFLTSVVLIHLIYHFNWVLLEPRSWVIHDQLPTSTQLLTTLLTIIRISPKFRIFTLRPFFGASTVRVLVTYFYRVPFHPLLWRPMLVVKFIFIFTVYQSQSMKAFILKLTRFWWILISDFDWVSFHPFSRIFYRPPRTAGLRYVFIV